MDPRSSKFFIGVAAGLIVVAAIWAVKPVNQEPKEVFIGDPVYQPVDVNNQRRKTAEGEPLAPIDEVGEPVITDNIVRVEIYGTYPDSCTTMREIRKKQEGDTFFVELITYVPEGSHCTDEKIKYRRNPFFNLDGLAPGTYNIDIHDVVVTFEITE